jgi:hypothetical protein
VALLAVIIDRVTDQHIELIFPLPEQININVEPV